MVSIYMPAYNVESWLAQTIARISPLFWEQIHSLHLIDDGSTDRTSQIAAQLAESNPKIIVHRFTQNQGYGSVVRFGLSRCLFDGSDIAVCLHGDGQYAPEFLSQFCSKLWDGSGLDLVQGSRHAEGKAKQGGMPLYKIIAGQVLTALENRVFGLRLSDYHSGYLAYRTDMLKRIPFADLKGNFEVDLELIAMAKAYGFRVGEIPIPTRYAGELSHLNPWVYGLRVLQVLKRYLNRHYHPARRSSDV